MFSDYYSCFVVNRLVWRGLPWWLEWHSEFYFSFLYFNPLHVMLCWGEKLLKEENSGSINVTLLDFFFCLCIFIFYASVFYVLKPVFCDLVYLPHLLLFSPQLLYALCNALCMQNLVFLNGTIKIVCMLTLTFLYWTNKLSFLLICLVSFSIAPSS